MNAIPFYQGYFLSHPWKIRKLHFSSYFHKVSALELEEIDKKVHYVIIIFNIMSKNLNYNIL